MRDYLPSLVLIAFVIGAVTLLVKGLDAYDAKRDVRQARVKIERDALCVTVCERHEGYLHRYYHECICLNGIRIPINY